MASELFSLYTLRSLTLRNRIVMSPMCMYSSQDGFANDWHLVHLGSRAVGGVGLVMTEAAAVCPEGRISPSDLGIWKDEHIEMLSRITQFIRQQGAVAGIQLAHAGRKASTVAPGDGDGEVKIEDGGWITVAPSSIKFAEHYPQPVELDKNGIQKLVDDFVQAVRRALKAGFEVIEVHAAHGYLLHEFLSPLSNQRQDEYGGSFENRIRIVCDVVKAVRAEWPQHLPLFVRISATDWADNNEGWNIEESIQLANILRELGVDLIDTSSGGTLPDAKIPLGAGYQTVFASRIRNEANIPTSAVGMITSPEQADHIVRTGQADLVFLGRELLRDPYWPLKAAQTLHVSSTWAKQYLRAAPRDTQRHTPR
jgi:2,4-dienoyl-CoA reductase-like NADH-dependent reductase (Old Yellow Enzyme family)